MGFASLVAFALVTDCQLLRTEFRNTFDQLHWNRLRQREPDRAFAEFVTCQLMLECGDQRVASERLAIEKNQSGFA